MKLKKVAAICSRTGAFYLFDQVDGSGEVTQWLGDGIALYPLYGLPVLDKENLCAMFDIPEKKRSKCIFRREDMPPSLCVEDWEAGERQLTEDWITVEYNGHVVKPLSTARGGVTFIQNMYLSPLEDMADYLQLYERDAPDGSSYIVAKNGMEIAAVIMPFDAIKLGFVDQLEKLAARCRRSLAERMEKEDAP